MMRDINQLEQKPILPVNSAALWLTVGVSFYLLLFTILMFSDQPSTPLFTLFTWCSLTVYLLSGMYLVQIRRYIARALGLEFRVWGIVKTVLLLMLWYLAFPLTQQRLNKLVELKTSV
jgi:hypothetical protein